MLGEFWIDQRGIAEQQKFSVGMPFQRSSGAGNNHRSADVATHGVKRNSNLLRHENPGNLISCGRESFGRATGKPSLNAALGEAQALAPRPGRDNSVSRPRHNLLTAAMSGTGRFRRIRKTKVNYVKSMSCIDELNRHPIRLDPNAS
jgi:hypothetical protein